MPSPTITVSILRSSVALAFGAFGVTHAGAFKLQPHASVVESASAKRDQDARAKIANWLVKFSIEKATDPVHEELTNLMYGCVSGNDDDCRNPDRDIAGIGYVMYGVRWNDDPPFKFEKNHGNFPGCKSGTPIRLVTFPECWVRVFDDGRKKSTELTTFDRKSGALLYRSHFGDLQFLHSMATRPKEPPKDTQDLVLAWAQFAWKVATGKITSGEQVSQVKIPVLATVFQGHGWDVMDLFATGHPLIQKNPKYLKSVAFGSLLHMVQDSFSQAHVERRKPDPNITCSASAKKFPAPGQIVEFHTYVGQNEELHAHDDTRAALFDQLQSNRPNVVDVGQVLVAYYERSADWEEVQPYFDCIFQLASAPRRASPGERYVR